MGFIRESFLNCYFKRSLNATPVMLFPKKGKTNDFKDFKPINLVGRLDNLLAKSCLLDLKW